MEEAPEEAKQEQNSDRHAPCLGESVPSKKEGAARRAEEIMDRRLSLTMAIILIINPIFMNSLVLAKKAAAAAFFLQRKDVEELGPDAF